METPEHERRQIEDYLRSQSGEKFQVEHVEKLTSEYVLGSQYDVWDAHTNEGRWWVITNPTNLYSQDVIKSMDVALSFHIGLMSRMLTRTPERQAESRDGWMLDVLRRLDAANASLDRSKEVEDYQAVGMRSREALLTLAAKLATLDLSTINRADSPKRGDFKAWAAVAADSLAAGSSAAALRGLLKASSEKTWDYVAWLTHARHATKLDAQVACSATTQLVETFMMATTRWRLGLPQRCPACSSNQLSLDYDPEMEWIKRCNVCDWLEPAEPPETLDRGTADDHETVSKPEGECVLLEDFGIYLSPQQARTMQEAAVQRADSGDEDACWAHPFTVVDGPTHLVDVHRLIFETARQATAPGTEFIYSCDHDACVNPDHAIEQALPAEVAWIIGVVVGVVLHPVHLEMHVSTPTTALQRVFIGHDVLDHYGLSDPASWSA